MAIPTDRGKETQRFRGEHASVQTNSSGGRRIALGADAMRSIPALAAVGSLAFATLAWAQAPVAVVEDVSGKVAGVEFMDYVAAGKVIKLGARDTLVLGYLKSCWRETITAGIVTIGSEQSEVQNGKVERTRVKCDGGQMNLSPE